MLPPFLLLPFFRSSCCCSLFICCPSVLSSSSPRVHPHRPQGEEQTSGRFWRKRESQESRKYLKVNQESRLPHRKLKSGPTWASPGYLGSVLSLEDVYQLLPGDDYNMILRRCESCSELCEIFVNTWCNHIMKRVFLPASVREIFGQSEEKLVAESWSPSRQAAQDQFHLLWIFDQSVFMFVVNA